MKEIKSSSGYMGKRYICTKCQGEVDITDEFCRWCGYKIGKKSNYEKEQVRAD